jgi:hypothetical protein
MKKLMVSALVLAMGLSILSVGVFAMEKTKKDMAVGKLEVVKEGDAITAINIVGKKTVSVVIDDKAKELAALEGKEVQVKGTTDADGKLTVTEFKEKVVKKEIKKKEATE